MKTFIAFALILSACSRRNPLETLDAQAVDVWQAQKKAGPTSAKRQPLFVEMERLRSAASIAARRWNAPRLERVDVDVLFHVNADGTVTEEFHSQRIIRFAWWSSRYVEVVTDARWPDRIAPEHIALQIAHGHEPVIDLRRDHGTPIFRGKVIDVTEYAVGAGARGREVYLFGNVLTYRQKNATAIFYDFETEFPDRPSHRHYHFEVPKAGALSGRFPTLATGSNGQWPSVEDCTSMATAWECEVVIDTASSVTIRLDLPYPGLALPDGTVQ